VAQTIHISAEIAASIDRVWQVLTGLDEYASWHPQISSAKGELRPGGKLEIASRGLQPAMGVTVVTVEPPQLLVYEGGDPEHVLVRHRWQLTDLGQGRTRIDDYEEFLGPQAEAMFSQHAAALRRDLEPIVQALQEAAETPVSAE
jgi:uncharacterized protein YndB with AHSA1/START domain